MYATIESWRWSKPYLILSSASMRYGKQEFQNWKAFRFFGSNVYYCWKLWHKERNETSLRRYPEPALRGAHPAYPYVGTLSPLRGEGKKGKGKRARSLRPTTPTNTPHASTQSHLQEHIKLQTRRLDLTPSPNFLALAQGGKLSLLFLNPIHPPAIKTSFTQRRHWANWREKRTRRPIQYSVQFRLTQTHCLRDLHSPHPRRSSRRKHETWTNSLEREDKTNKTMRLLRELHAHNFRDDVTPHSWGVCISRFPQEKTANVDSKGWYGSFSLQ